MNSEHQAAPNVEHTDSDEFRAARAGVASDSFVMPDSALIHAIGYAGLKGAKRSHVEILAHQVSYLLTQLTVSANTYDPEGEEGLREHVNKVRESCFESLSKIFEA